MAMASPQRCSGLSSKLEATRGAAPASEMISPTRKPRPICSRKNSQAPSVTKIGPVIVSRLALAMVVSFSPQCQATRSPLQNTPAMMSVNQSRRSMAVRAPSPRCSTSIHTNRTGIASSTRCTAVALGPISLARTSKGEKARPRIPPANVTRAPRFWVAGSKCGTGQELDRQILGRRLRLLDGSGEGARRFEGTVLWKSLGIGRNDAAALRQHFEEPPRAADQGNDALLSREHAAHVGRLQLE